MSEWNVEVTENKIYIDDNEVFSTDEPITAEVVKAVARDNGYKQFEVENAIGEALAPRDFPISEDVFLTQINKAGL